MQPARHLHLRPSGIGGGKRASAAGLVQSLSFKNSSCFSSLRSPLRLLLLKGSNTAGLEVGPKVATLRCLSGQRSLARSLRPFQDIVLRGRSRDNCPILR